ncbi:hypothetical protein DdX_16907 [Ditylenchus destructor]|uniref:Uncharacterized protein n=1 Tax=Ditylenchus destructor TaxID=166010 RepID=A0AAD4QW91_9BILA|nr:hypothetical protein DdX_16907 [Ditylenchus destructor]
MTFSERLDAIIDTALHVKWAEVVGNYLIEEIQGYQNKFHKFKEKENPGNLTLDTPQNRPKDEIKKLTDANAKLNSELEKFTRHMEEIRDLLRKVTGFFGKVAPPPKADPGVVALISNNIFDYIPSDLELITKLKGAFRPEDVKH